MPETRPAGRSRLGAPQNGPSDECRPGILVNMSQLINSAESAVRAAPALSRPRRRWLLWTGLLLALALVWLAAIYFYFTYGMDRDLRAAMAEADLSSPGGWQMNALESQREQIPDEENAALVVLKVKELLPAVWPPTTAKGNASSAGQKLVSAEIEKLRPELPLPADLFRSLQALLDPVKPARAEARKLIGMTRGRYPLNWEDSFSTTLVSNAALIAADLLRNEAALASQERDADRALASVRGIIGAARSLGDEPLFMSVILRLDCDAMAVAALERSLAQGEPSRRELEALQALLETEAREPMLTRAVRGERAGLHQLMLSLRNRQASLPQIAGEGPGFGRFLLDTTGPTLARRSHPRILRLMNEYVAALELPIEQQEPELGRLEKKVRKAHNEDHDLVINLVLPAFTRLSEIYRRGIGNLRCATAAAALERYRLDHGRWPETLNALIPRYLTAVPTDPRDAKPLRYTHRPEGVVIYSVGGDGVDDGGKLDRSANYYAKGIDQGIQLWDAKQRPSRDRAPR
jgi:hypothetical protein